MGQAAKTIREWRTYPQCPCFIQVSTGALGINNLLHESVTKIISSNIVNFQSNVKKLKEQANPPIAKLREASEIVREEGFWDLLINLRKFTVRRLGTTQIGWRCYKYGLQRRAATETDADPFKTIWVDPNQIKYITGQVRNPHHPEKITDESFRGIKTFGSVRDGDWDINNCKFEQHWKYRAIKQWYIDDVPWEKTDFFSKKMESNPGSEQRKELIKHCKRYEELINNIKSDGYKTQKELATGQPNKEVCVNIGRNGRLLFNGSGHHRLAIAKVLDLSEIPVVIRVRHSSWQKIREHIIKGNIDEIDYNKIQNHPDLQDILNG